MEKATADGSEHLEGVITSTKKKKKIRFPKMKAVDAAVGDGKVNVDVSTHEGEASGSKLKAKMKGPKFGMNFPKIKKSKLDVQSSNDSFEVKELEGKFKPPSVECDSTCLRARLKQMFLILRLVLKEKERVLR